MTQRLTEGRKLSDEACFRDYTAAPLFGSNNADWGTTVSVEVVRGTQMGKTLAGGSSLEDDGSFASRKGTA